MSISVDSNILLNKNENCSQHGALPGGGYVIMVMAYLIEQEYKFDLDKDVDDPEVVPKMITALYELKEEIELECPDDLLLFKEIEEEKNQLRKLIKELENTKESNSRNESLVAYSKYCVELAQSINNELPEENRGPFQVYIENNQNLEVQVQPLEELEKNIALQQEKINCLEQKKPVSYNEKDARECFEKLEKIEGWIKKLPEIRPGG